MEQVGLNPDCAPPGRGSAYWRYDRGGGRRASFTTIPVAFLAAAVGVIGCGESPTAPVSPPSTAAITVTVPVGATLVESIVVRVTATDIDTLFFNLPVVDSTAEGSIVVPVGAAREFLLSAFDIRAVETHRGADTVDIAAENNAITIRLDPLTGEQPIDATITDVTITIVPAVVSLLVGDSANLSAFVITTAGDTLSSPPILWVSLDPDIAAVDSAGRVEGLRVGDAKITAVLRLTGGTAIAATATIYTRVPFVGSPYPASASLSGMALDWTTHVRLADGSDNWPVTWSDDGHQYTSWGDGGGFGGTNNMGRVSLGIARVEGSGSSYSGVNINGGVSPESGNSTLSGKSYGLLSVAETLYMWQSPGSDLNNWDSVELYRSRDKGATWDSLWVGWTESDGVGIPGILQFGKGYSGARDGYVYSYFINIKNASSLRVQIPGEIVLARVPLNQIETLGAYEWFGGLDGSGQPVWTSDVANRTPVFEDPKGVGWTVSVIYNPGVDRYLLMTEHDKSFVGNLGLFDAPEPWGPWTTVAYETNWPSGGEVQHSTFYWNFSAKWWSNGGEDFVLVFSGIDENDTWNTVHGSFVLP